MNQALEIQAFRETTGWLLGKMVSPIHTKPARIKRVIIRRAYLCVVIWWG